MAALSATMATDGGVVDDDENGLSWNGELMTRGGEVVDDAGG